MAIRQCADARLQVSPGGRHESASAVWKDQDEPEGAMAAHLAQNGEAEAFKWMPMPNNRNFRRNTLEVGSVLAFRLDRLSTRGSCDS